MSSSPQLPPTTNQSSTPPQTLDPGHHQSESYRSNLSHQLSGIRQAYERDGYSPAVPNIPLPSTSTRNVDSHLEPSTSFRSVIHAPNRQSDSNVVKVDQSPRQGIRITDSKSSCTSPNHTPAFSFRSMSSKFNRAGPSGARRDSSLEDITDAQKAMIVRRHLMSRDQQNSSRRLIHSSKVAYDGTEPFQLEPDGSDSNVESDLEGPDPSEAEQYPTPYHLQGGDIHHDVYKWANKFPSGQRLSQAGEARGSNLALSRTRSLSMSVTSLRISEPGSATVGYDSPSEIAPKLVYKDIMQPGGFRRAYLHQKRAMIGHKGGSEQDGKKITKSFIDFLSLYGHFGGEDLEEIDEEDEAAYRALQDMKRLEEGASDDESLEEEGVVGERTSLLASSGRNKTRGPSNAGRSRRSQSMRPVSKYPGFSGGSDGDATVTQAVLMLLKSLVGTGVLFLAKAFSNGGMLFSIVTLVLISAISTYSFVLLVKTRLEIPGGFGEIGGILYGPWCRWAILSSLVISQLGFVAAYTIFIAQNLQAFILAITDCQRLIPIYVLIFGQLVAYLPLAMIRNIQKLSGTALIADVFILIGLLYVFGYEIDVISRIGVAPIQAFNPDSFALLIGTAVFAFEGIGLVIPITESMKQPERFPAVLIGVMTGLTFLFAGAGALGYAAFGSDVQTVVIVNLPQEDKMVNAVQFLYSMAIMLSTPLQLFPAVRIMENGLFSNSGKYSNKVKWEKNLFRTLVVIFCAFIAWTGASDLDKFVSLIGSVACVPLCFCYPAMLHYRARAKTVRQKAADIALFVFGICAAVYTTAQTLIIMAGEEDGRGGGPKFGKCEVP